MSTLLKTSVMATGLVAMLIADAPLLPVQLVPDAQAILGVRRRTAVVVGTEVHAADEAKMAQSQQQTAAAQQQAAAAQQQAAAAQQQAAAAAPAPPPAAAGKQLPVGTVVPALPKGCTSTPVGGVEYYYCGGNFYRAVFQGNALVYVTAQPK
jgi:biotin carboxyl carrier protein